MVAATFETPKTRAVSPTGPGWYRQRITEIVKVDVPVTAINEIGDKVGLLWVPAGAVIITAAHAVTDMDTGGPTMTFNIGDTAVPARFFAGSTAGGTGTAGGVSGAVVANGFVATAFGFKYTVATEIYFTVLAAPTTPAAGTITFSIDYIVDPDFASIAATTP